MLQMFFFLKRIWNALRKVSLTSLRGNVYFHVLVDIGIKIGIFETYQISTKFLTSFAFQAAFKSTSYCTLRS